MTEKRQPPRQAAQGRDQAAQPPGLDHGAASLVATDSPDDPQTGAPAGQISRSQPQTRPSPGKS